MTSLECLALGLGAVLVVAWFALVFAIAELAELGTNNGRKSGRGDA
jgi:hypothetical protein